MENLDNKLRLLSSGIYSKFCKIRKQLISNNLYFAVDDPNYYGLNSLDFHCCIQLYKSNYNRFKLLSDRVSFMFKNYDFVYFATFTFNDDSLKLSPRSRRVHICDDILDLIAGYYILNIDFSDSGREHYHCVFASNSLLDSFVTRSGTHYKLPHDITYRYGFYKIDLVGSESAAPALYLKKLTAHSLKVRSRITYKRIY